MGIIDVRDNGIGLSPDEQAHLFDRFFRAAATPCLEGTVWDCRSRAYLSRCMGGGSLLPVRLGKGSTFSFTLPVADVPPWKLRGRVISSHHPIIP